MYVIGYESLMCRDNKVIFIFITSWDRNIQNIIMGLSTKTIDHHEFNMYASAFNYLIFI